jgi:hypothetical protein
MQLTPLTCLLLLLIVVLSDGEHYDESVIRTALCCAGWRSYIEASDWLRLISSRQVGPLIAVSLGFNDFLAGVLKR